MKKKVPARKKAVKKKAVSARKTASKKKPAKKSAVKKTTKKKAAKKPTKKTPKKAPPKKKPAKKKPSKKVKVKVKQKKDENIIPLVPVEIKRNDKGQFKNGQSGNPKGKPKGAKSISDSLRMMMDATSIDIMLRLRNLKNEESYRCIKVDTSAQQDMKAAVAASLIVEALSGNVAAAREIYDRIDGKPPVAVQGLFDGVEVIIDDEDDTEE